MPAPCSVARYAADPDNRRAEFAAAVRSDWKARGLGYLLMTRLLDIARQRGVREIYGEVERGNQPMLDLCRSLEFAIVPNPDDAQHLRANKTLAEIPAAS